MGAKKIDKVASFPASTQEKRAPHGTVLECAKFSAWTQAGSTSVWCGSIKSHNLKNNRDVGTKMY